MRIEKITACGDKAAYVAAGEEKVALIDVPSGDKQSFAAALGKYEKIDYLILNHVDPSMGENICAVLEKYPYIEVHSSAAARKFAEELTNRSFNVVCCKHEHSIELGGGELKFFITPNLSWPDTMMTYSSDGQLFSGDFFAEENASSVLEEYVLSALEIVKKINPSEILTRSGSVGLEVTEEYEKSIRPKKRLPIIVYCSNVGFTKSMAQKLGEHFQSSKIFDLSDGADDDVIELACNAEALFVGTHTENGNMPTAVWNFFSKLDSRRVKNIPYLVFGSGAWSNEGIYMADAVLQRFKMRRADKPVIANLNPTAEDMERLISSADKYTEVS